jgi:hypothetical protein
MGRNSNKLVTLPERFVPQFWDEADGRVAVIKEIKRRCESLKADAQADSYQKDLLCQRAIFIVVQLETFEVVALQNGGLNAGVYTQMTNTLIGLLKSLGLERRAKQIDSLASYINKKRK